MVKTKSGDVISLEKSEQKKITKRTKKLTKNIKDGKITIKQRKPRRITVAKNRGLVYIAHIPHGFYEDAMKNYFKQFGVITNVMVCRSRKNGNSKGYGYVEFLHPDVAKVAAETMNNYLMFKKRIVAEYVPFDKRPKGLFKGKASTPTRYSSKIRREKQIIVNSSINSKTHLKRSKTRLSNFNKKMQKLENAGVDSNIQPTDLPDGIKQEKQSDEEPTPFSYQQDPFDSDIEVKLPLKRSKNSIKQSLSQALTSKTSASKASTSKISSKSRTSMKSKSVEPTSSNKVLLAKSLDSVKTLLSNKASSRSTNVKSVSVKQVNKATSISKLKKKKEKIDKPKGVVKKSKKQILLSPEILKKIARELIRKKGNSLLDLVTTPRKKKGKKASGK